MAVSTQTEPSYYLRNSRGYRTAEQIAEELRRAEEEYNRTYIEIPPEPPPSDQGRGGIDDVVSEWARTLSIDFTDTL